MISAAQLSRIAPEGTPAFSIILHRERFGIYRAQCCNTTHDMVNSAQFDIFGELKPGSNGTAADAVVAKCIQHAEVCAGRKNPTRTEVRQNQNTPDLFLVRIEWD